MLPKKTIWINIYAVLILMLVLGCFAGKSEKKSSKKHGQDMVGNDDDKTDRYSKYDPEVPSSDESFEDMDGRKGRDPERYGQDMGDRKKIYETRQPMSGSMYLWIDETANWEQKGKKYDEYGSDKYDDKDKYKKPSKGYDKKDDSQRSKRSYKRVEFPVRRYKNYKHFPINRFPPLHATFPWLPIFYDKVTYQTIIFSPAGGVYILPPLINFVGKRFAVAQLIKWGYASLTSAGGPPLPGFNVAPLVNPVPPVGAPGAAAPPSIPYNPATAQFGGGVNIGSGAYQQYAG